VIDAMVLKADQQRVKSLLSETILLLCKNGLNFNKELSIEGLIGITLDQEEVFLVSIKETISSVLEVDDVDVDPGAHAHITDSQALGNSAAVPRRREHAGKKILFPPSHTIKPVELGKVKLNIEASLASETMNTTTSSLACTSTSAEVGEKERTVPKREVGHVEDVIDLYDSSIQLNSNQILSNISLSSQTCDRRESSVSPSSKKRRRLSTPESARPSMTTVTSAAYTAVVSTDSDSFRKNHFPNKYDRNAETKYVKLEHSEFIEINDEEEEEEVLTERESLLEGEGEGDNKYQQLYENIMYPGANEYTEGGGDTGGTSQPWQVLTSQAKRRSRSRRQVQ